MSFHAGTIRRFLAVSLVVGLLPMPAVFAATAVSASATLNEDSSKQITLRGGATVRNETLTYSISTQPVHGSVSLSGQTATYTPTSNYNGSDSFAFVVTGSSSGASSPATISLTINPTNDAPVANPVTATTDYLTPVTVILLGSDVDGDSLSYSVPRGVAFGTVSAVSGNQVTYTPMVGYEGTISFNYSVRDNARTTSGSVTITVTDVPAVPVLTAATTQGRAVAISLPTQNATGDTFSLSNWTQPSYGTLTRTSSGWDYTPQAGFVGVDTFNFVVLSGTSTVTGIARVNVTPITGIAQTPIVQLGLNFMNLLNNSLDGASQYLTVLQDLGIQAVRQVGDGDVGWGAIEVNGQERDPSIVAAARRDFQNAGIQVDNTLLAMMFASCTPPGQDYTDSTQLVDHMTEDCADYLLDAVDYIHAVTPAGNPVVYEPGNELFHWVAYPEYTTEEQAVVSGYAMDTMLSGLSALGRTVVTRAPSIMIDSEMTWDWWNTFTATLDSAGVPGSSADLIYENYHYYATDEVYLEKRNAFEAAGMWKQPKLMQLTEFGYSDDPTTERVENPSPYNKALRTVRMAIMAWGAGDSAVYYHTLLNTYDHDNDLRGTGLIDPDTQAYTPAAYTLRLISDELVPFTQVSVLSAGDILLYQFKTDAGQTKYVVWGSGTFTVPSGMTASTSMVNEAGSFTWSHVTPGQTLTLTEVPLLLK